MPVNSTCMDIGNAHHLATVTEVDAKSSMHGADAMEEIMMFVHFADTLP